MRPVPVMLGRFAEEVPVLTERRRRRSSIRVHEVPIIVALMRRMGCFWIFMHFSVRSQTA